MSIWLERLIGRRETKAGKRQYQETKLALNESGKIEWIQQNFLEKRK